MGGSAFLLRCNKFVFWIAKGISLALLIVSILTVPVMANLPGSLPQSSVAPARLAQSSPTTTLSISVLSSPWAVLDNKPTTGPQVFIVQTAVTNTGAVAATDVVVTLDYNDPVNGWVLLPGEIPTRTHTSLAPGSVVYDYWFARYPPVTGASFQYTVRARADNAAQVATSDNAFGNPELNKTVKTRKYLSTGNSGITQAAADVSVGRAFTVTVDYSWTGTPTALGFSPVGNVDYDPSAYRLLGAQVRLYSTSPAAGGTLLRTVNDRVYVTQVGAAQYAQTEYTFIAVTAHPTRLCPYTGVDYGSTQKYDTNYCTGGPNSTIISFDSVLSTELTKHVNVATVQQGETLTYTLRFTNSNETAGNLLYAWVWDEVTPFAGSVVTTSLMPSGDPNGTTASRAAWYLGTVAPGFAGTYTFTFRVDGDGTDLADQTSIVNHAFFGINEGSVPPRAALTDTVTVTLQAPAIQLSQSDGLLTTDVGQPFAYTLRITNSGTITATNVVITDVLPAHVTLTGPVTPAPNESGAGWLAWTFAALAPGQSQVLTVPVQTVVGTSDGTVLGNTVTARYANPAGHVYALKEATDVTVVHAPTLQIVKQALLDLVLRGAPITYTLSYTNAGSLTATDAWISDVIPADTTYMACAGGSTCALDDGIVTWTLGALPPGASGAVTLTVRAGETFQVVNVHYGIHSAETGPISGSPVTTTVAAEPGHIDVYTFVDLNTNGVRDAGESALAGVAITVPSAIDPFTITDAISRTYPFTVPVYGPMSVTTSLPAAYFRTTPETVYLFNEFGVTQTLGFGYAPISVTYAVIYGTVFSDANHNGVWDAGETGLPGVTLTSAEASPTSTTTNAFGNFTLRFPISGSVTLTATTPAGYIATMPEVVSTVAVTDAVGVNNFGYFAGIEVIGQAFADTNVNGLWDVGELGLGGVTVTGDGDSVLSDPNGVFTLHVALDGPVLIGADAPAGYVSTNALPGAAMTRIDARILHVPTPVAGQTYTGGAFGLAPAGDVVTLTGHVWEDASVTGLANGVWDAGEPGLPGVLVGLSSGLARITDAAGAFTLYAPAGEAVTLTATNPPGYLFTNAIPGTGATKYDNRTLLVAAQTGGTALDGHAFGAVLADGVAVITGAVFDDANGDGVRDGGETGLPGVTVTLEIDGGLSIPLVTDANGDYRFAVAPGVAVRITAARPAPDYYPTTPESQVFYLSAAGVYPGYDFGFSNVPVPGMTTIYGLVFEDLNANGIQDFGEPGLAGAVVTLTLEGAPLAVVTTTGDGVITGTFRFTVTTPGVYAVLNQNPPGYRSTTTDEIPVVITDTLSESARFVTFGATPRVIPISIYGLVFEDANNNGVWDPGEAGIPGVTLTLDGSATTTSDAHGNYSFPVDWAGVHVVVKTDPPGYIPTTPNTVAVLTEIGGSYRIDFGNIQPDVRFATVYGIVYEDSNADGEWQPGEAGLEGVLITLNGYSATTDIYGRYTISTTVPGLVSVVQTDLPLYYSTTPNVVPLALELGESYQVNFGDNTPGLGVLKSAEDENGAPLLPGDVLRYVITITNASMVALMHDVWVTDTLPAGLTFIEADLAPVTESPLTWYRSTMAPNETWEITVWVLVDGSANLIGPNTAQVSSAEQTPQETEPVVPPAGGEVDPGLILVKTAADEDGAPLYIGDFVQYVITVTNASTQTTQTGVIVTDTLPAGVTFVEATLKPDAQSPLVWSVGVLAPGAVWTATVRVQVDGSADPIGGNVAHVSSDQQAVQATGDIYPPDSVLHYILAVETVGAGDVAVDPDQASYHYGDVVTLTATADLGWTFAGWSGDASGTDAEIAVTIAGNTVVTATFTQDQYTLDVTLIGDGAVDVDPAGPYVYGDVATLTATADPGWTFAGWSGDASGTDAEIAVTIAGNTVVTATFTQDQYTLDVTLIGDGAVDVDPAGPYVYGDVATLTATADPGWTFAGWSGDAGGTDAEVVVTIEGNTAITATFTQDEYTLTVNTVGDGSVTRNPAQATYHYGDVVTLTATANPGWMFAGWSGGASGATAEIVVTIEGHTAVTATFTQDEYTLAVDTVGDGNVTRNPAQATYHYGDVVTLTATADPGWTFAGWSGDAGGTDAEIAVTIEGNTTVTATFTQDQYTLTIDTMGEGSVTRNPAQATYHRGDVVTLMATPALGWTFAGWSGDAGGTDAEIAVTIAGNTTVTATFTQDQYTLTIDTMGDGSVTRNPAQATYHYGDVVTLTATPAVGWTFAGWSGDASGTDAEIAVTIAGHTAVTATFTQDAYTLTINTSGGGNVTRNPDQATYHYGDVVTFTATAAPGWTFAGWSGDASGTNAELAVTIENNTAVTATFTQDEYTLAVDTVGGGNVTRNPAQATYHYGDVVTLTATAAPGWTFAGWSGDASGATVEITVTIAGNTAVTATFQSKPVCTVLTDVAIVGPTYGYTDIPNTFSGVITPTDATMPLTLTWASVPLSGQGTLTTTYEWTTSGLYTLTLRAEHCGGVLTATHAVTIEASTAPLCKPDAYEEDDTLETARPIVVGETQARNFFDDAVDWITVTVRAGNTYTFTTAVEGPYVDTVLSLFDRDGQTLLMENDNAPGSADLSSRIVWQAPHNGVYYLRVTDRTGFIGCETDYTLSVAVREIRFIYLPLVLRNHGVLR